MQLSTNCVAYCKANELLFMMIFFFSDCFPTNFRGYVNVQRWLNVVLFICVFSLKMKNALTQVRY